MGPSVPEPGRLLASHVPAAVGPSLAGVGRPGTAEICAGNARGGVDVRPRWGHEREEAEARRAQGRKVTAPLPPSDPSYPVHKAAEERARAYVWESFQPGNALSIRHGAQSERVVGPLADQLAEWLVAEYPDLAEGRYAFSVSAWARAEARAALLSLFLDAQGLVHGDGDRRGEAREHLLEQVRKEERRASEERKNLGLNPAAHATLEKQRAEALKGAVDLTELQRRGREAIEARAAREETG